MIACFHSISRCQALFLAYSRHSFNAACMHMIVSKSWLDTTLRGEPSVACQGSAGALLSLASTQRLGRRWLLWCPDRCPSELVAGGAVQRGLQHIRVLGFAAQCLLLPHLLGFGTVPISFDVLVVPHD